MTNILVLIPTIVNAVKAIELMMPQGTGSDKLAAVIATIESIYGALNESMPAITNFIGVVVAGFNAMGFFKRKAA